MNILPMSIRIYVLVWFIMMLVYFALGWQPKAIEQVFWKAVTNYSFLILGSPGIFVMLSFIGFTFNDPTPGPFHISIVRNLFAHELSLLNFVTTTLFITGVMVGITVTMLMKMANSG